MSSNVKKLGKGKKMNNYPNMDPGAINKEILTKIELFTPEDVTGICRFIRDVSDMDHADMCESLSSFLNTLIEQRIEEVVIRLQAIEAMSDNTNKNTKEWVCNSINIDAKKALAVLLPEEEKAECDHVIKYQYVEVEENHLDQPWVTKTTYCEAISDFCPKCGQALGDKNDR